MNERNGCEDRREAIVALTLGELEAEATRELHEHIKGCESCRRFYEDVAREEQAVRSTFESLATVARPKTQSEVDELAGSPERASAFDRGDSTRSPLRVWSLARKVAAAAVFIGVAYAAGRVSAPPPPDIGQLRSELEAALRTSMASEFDRRLEPAVAAACAQLKDELHRDVRRDLVEFASQILTASSTLTDRRIVDLVQLIEATRRQDRVQVEVALEQIERERLNDMTLFGKGLAKVAAMRDRPPPVEKK